MPVPMTLAFAASGFTAQADSGRYWWFASAARAPSF
jgi:hypothetical protein